MNIHIYRADDQRATSYSMASVGFDRAFTNPPGRLFWTMCCDKRRPAKNLNVHVYYDGTYYFCASNKGCKDPAFIEAKRRREWRNRSLGNKRAWALRRSSNSAPSA